METDYTEAKTKCKKLHQMRVAVSVSRQNDLLGGSFGLNLLFNFQLTHQNAPLLSVTAHFGSELCNFPQDAGQSSTGPVASFAP